MRKLMLCVVSLLMLCCSLVCQTASAETLKISSMPHNMRCLYAAYWPYIKMVIKKPDSNTVYFLMHNGTKIIWNDGVKKTFDQRLNKPDLSDILNQRYRIDQPVGVQSAKNYDPGRYRNMAFLKAVYGETQAAVKKNLVQVRWLPTLSKTPTYVLFNKQNGAAAALRRVSQELNKLPKRYKKYLTNIGGTFKWRKVAGTGYLSPHSFGIAIDITVKYSNYWRWDNKKNINAKHLRYVNRIPTKIVKIFELNHFIWGGKWYHYDSMHFEYRPEFFCKAR